MKYLIFVVVGLIVVAMIIFGLQNGSPVAVEFLGLQSGGVPIYSIVLLSGLIGMLAMGLLSLPGSIQSRIQLRRQRQQIVELEKQIEELKARLPKPVMRPLPEDNMPSRRG